LGAASGGHLAVVERLLEKKAEVNAAAGYYGRTALQAAAEGGHLAVVERLLQEKAEVNAAAAAAAAWYSGRTALQAAAAGYSGRTALQAAAEGGHLAIMKCLCDGGAI
jgi:ankyrin repeat protein